MGHNSGAKMELVVLGESPYIIDGGGGTWCLDLKSKQIFDVDLDEMMMLFLLLYVHL